MRGLLPSILVAMAITAPALAKPKGLVELPPIVADQRSLRAPQVMVITPSTPRRKQPEIDVAARLKLQRRLQTLTGADRLAALDTLTASLDAFEAADAEFELVMAEVNAHYAMVLAVPGLER